MFNTDLKRYVQYIGGGIFASVKPACCSEAAYQTAIQKAIKNLSSSSFHHGRKTQAAKLTCGSGVGVPGYWSDLVQVIQYQV